MYAASREACARSREALRAALAGSDSVAATTGSELFAVVAVLDDQRSLRVALADVSVPGSARAELSERVFGGKVSPATQAVLTTAVAQDWSRTADLVDTLVLLGQEALLESAADTGRGGAGVEGRDVRVAIPPALSVIVVVWLVALPALWLLHRAGRRRPQTTATHAITYPADSTPMMLCNGRYSRPSPIIVG